MRRSNTKTTKKENNLFNYFTKIKGPNEKKKSMSMIIANSTASISKTSATISKTTISPSVTEQFVDLTEDDDIEMPLIPSTPVPEKVYSVDSSQSSFGSQRQRPQDEEMVNTCKYNNKAWSARSKERGYTPSSQDTSALQERKVERFQRLELKKARITARPTYDWLGPDDVKPFSSNFSSNITSSSSSALRIRKPDIAVQFYSAQTGSKRPRDNGYATSFDGGWDSQGSSSQRSFSSKKWDGESIPTYSASALKNTKEGWEDSYGITTTESTLSSSQNTQAFWDAVAKKKNEANQRYSKVKMEKFASNNNKYSRPASYNTNNFNARTPDTEYRPELSDEQQRVLNMVLTERRSLFFTGSAGTGKSVLLRAIIDKLGERYGSQLAVTASTGIAACNINGSTLHSFGGIGIAKESAKDLANKIRHDNRKARDRWTSTRVLIIDEISMVDADLFDKLDIIARDLRQNPTPFGGMQIIVTGDFFQLPPVNPNKVSKFAFEAKCWPEAIKQTVMLTKVFRQKDGTFIRILNEMRLGRLSEEAIQKFKSLSRAPENKDDIEPTELYPLRNEVDLSNKRRLEALQGEIIEFTAIDKGDSRKMASCLAPQIIQMKEHAQVMLLKNIDAELVNGSLGVVVGFVGKGKYAKKKSVEKLRTPHRQKDALMDLTGDIDMSVPYPVVKFSCGRTLVLERESWSVELPGGREHASREQIPLMLAWAISIHKSQGQTLDRVKVDLGKVFEKGQAYVALSRATSLESLQILNFDPVRVMAHPTVTRFYQSLQTV